jgi:hypothetical protein
MDKDWENGMMWLTMFGAVCGQVYGIYQFVISCKNNEDVFDGWLWFLGGSFAGAAIGALSVVWMPIVVVFILPPIAIKKIIELIKKN